MQIGLNLPQVYTQEPSVIVPTLYESWEEKTVSSSIKVGALILVCIHLQDVFVTLLPDKSVAYCLYFP